jgi:type II secretory pathway pseudopilin PulG
MTLMSLQDIIIYNLHIYGGFSHINLGTITLERKPAFYSADKKTIFPPQTFLTLKKEYIAELDVKYNSKDYSEDLALLNSFLLSENIAFPEFIIPGVGIIKKSIQGHSFTPEENLSWVNGYKNWPALPVVPKELNLNSIEFAIENPKKLIFNGDNQNKRKVNFLFPVFVIGLISLFFLSRLITFSNKKEQNNLILSEETVKSKSDEVKNSAQVADTTKIIFSDSIDDSPNDTTITTNYNKIPATEKTRKLPNKPHVVKNSESISNQKFCIYVVGAFSKKQNAQGLKSKLIKEGYSADFYPSGNFYRVGISLSCNKDTSVAFTKLLKKFPDIWLLNP